jgi:hypothetical protein
MLNSGECLARLKNLHRYKPDFFTAHLQQKAFEVYDGFEVPFKFTDETLSLLSLH